MADTSTASHASAAPLARTPLFALHAELGAKFVGFAGYEMPIQFPAGILAEHQHTRAKAGLFDVSHMGQAFLIGADHATVARALEAVVPGDVQGLKPGQMRYSLLLTDQGTIVDDLMITRGRAREDDGKLFLVVNAARKEVDYAFLAAHLPAGVRLEPAPERALIALQGPAAARVLASQAPGADALTFMTARSTKVAGVDCHVSRSGYTGEDGFEISVPSASAEALARALLSDSAVQDIGLGARDSLRLEAGLCLYGHDIDETTTPVEAGLTWAIGKRRKMDRDFPGAARIMSEIFDGARRKRVGIRPEGRAPAREGTEICDSAGRVIGRVTSGGFGPSLGGPLAMGYVETAFGEDGTALQLLVRGTPHQARVVPMPFVAHRYVRSKT